METATPNKCVHLFVANWELAHSDNQPSAILGLEGQGVPAMSKLWVLAPPRAKQHPAPRKMAAICLCLVRGIPRFFRWLEEKA